MSTNKNREASGVLLTIVLYFVTRVLITAKVGVQGSAYIFSALDFIMIFVLYVPYALKHIVSKLVAAKLKQGQGANARRIVYGAFLVSFFYSIIVCLLLFLAKDGICSLFLLKKASHSIFVNLLPALFCSSFISVIRGFFVGVKSKGTDKLIGLIQAVSIMVFSILFCTIYINMGNKVSTVLYNKEYEFAYGSIGTAIGISVGMGLTLIISYILYYFNKSKLKISSPGQKSDDIYDVFSWISGDILKNSGFMVIFAIFMIINQALFFGANKGPLETITLSYKWGNYSGLFMNILVLVFLYFQAGAFLQKKSIRIASKSANVSELRIKVSDVLSSTFVISIFLAFIVLSAAGPIICGLEGIDTSLGTNIARTGSILIIPVAFAIVCSNILNGISKHTKLLLNSLVALVLGSLSAILFVSVINFSIFGVIIAMYVYSITLSVLNYFTIKKSLRFTPDVMSRVIPAVIINAIAAVITFLLVLLLGLFLNQLITGIIVIVLYFIGVFIAMCKFNVINSYTLANSLVGRVFLNVAKKFKLVS